MCPIFLALFIILVSLAVTLFGEKVLISKRCFDAQLYQKILDGLHLRSDDEKDILWDLL